MKRFSLLAFSSLVLISSALATEMVMRRPYDAKLIDQNIALHQGRVQRDPGGAIGWSMLAEAWLARSRESDSDAAAWEAETAARKSLSIRQRGNGRAMAALLDSLLEQHRFMDTLAVMDEYGVQTRTRADVLIELGRYDEAEAFLNKIAKADDSALTSIRARLALLRGQNTDAVNLLEAAMEPLAGNPGVSVTTLAWFNVKLGDAVRASGDSVRAEKLYREALTWHPRNYKATLAMARIATAKKDWDKVIAFGEWTLRICGSLDAKSMIGDAYAAKGDKTRADKWYADCHESYLSEVSTFAKLGKGGPLQVKPIDRQFAHFSSTHNLYVTDGLVAAERDFQNRPDPHATETLAKLKELVAKA